MFSNKRISNIILICTLVAAVAGLYAWYRDNVWKPHVELLQVDYDNGIAQLLVNHKKMTLYNNERLAAGRDWNIQFSGNRLELLKGDYVKDVINIQS